MSNTHSNEKTLATLSVDHDADQVSGSLVPAMSDKQDISDRSDLGLILAHHPILDNWDQEWMPSNLKGEILGGHGNATIANVAQDLTQFEPAQPAPDNPDQIAHFQHEYDIVHQTDSGYNRDTMNPNEMDYLQSALPESYKGFIRSFEEPQEPWLGFDHQTTYDYAHQAVGQEVDKPPVLPTIEAPPIATYESRFNTFEAARASIEALNTAELMLPLGLPGDDCAFVMGTLMHYYAKRLYEALGTPPIQCPEIMKKDYQKKYWREHQASTLAVVIATIMSSPDTAEARVILLLEVVFKLHTEGCPASVMNRKTLKEGYKVEATLIASARLEQIIDAASTDKYVAHNILTGTKIDDIVRSPAAYLRRKAENAKVNAKKAMEKEKADRDKGMVAKKKSAAKKSTVTTKRKGEAADVQQQDPYPSPMPTPPAPGPFFGLSNMRPFSYPLRAPDGYSIHGLPNHGSPLRAPDGSTAYGLPNGDEEMEFQYD